MSNPTTVSCALGVWTKVLDNKTTGNVYIQSPDWPQVVAMTPVYCAWVDTGQAAPETDVFTGAILLDDNVINFDRTAASDCYLCPIQKAVSALVDA